MGFSDEVEFTVTPIPLKPLDSPSLRVSNVTTLFYSKPFDSISKEKRLLPISDPGILSTSFPSEFASSKDAHDFPKIFLHKPSLLELESRQSMEFTSFRKQFCLSSLFQICRPTHNLALDDGYYLVATTLHDTIIHPLYIFQAPTTLDTSVKLVVEIQFKDEGFHDDADFVILPKPPDQTVITRLSPVLPCISKQSIQLCLEKEEVKVEMSERRSIIAGTCEKNLVLVDEICRGTETSKGTCIAGNIIELSLPFDPGPLLLPPSTSTMILALFAHNYSVPGNDIFNTYCQMNYQNSASKVFDQMPKRDSIFLYLPKETIITLNTSLQHVGKMTTNTFSVMLLTNFMFIFDTGGSHGLTNLLLKYDEEVVMQLFSLQWSCIIFGKWFGYIMFGSQKARVASYKVCWPPINGDEFFDAYILVAFDMAIHEEVDVLSLSLGGSASNCFNDSVAIVSFHAVNYGETMGFFHVDHVTCQYLKLTGRSDETVSMIAAITKAAEFTFRETQQNLGMGMSL